MAGHIGGFLGMVAGGAAAVVGGAATVVAGTAAAVGGVVHEGVLLGGDVMEGAINGVITGFHDLTVSEQEERAALLYSLRAAAEVGPENVAIQQRLAIAKCFQPRLAAQIYWPVEGLDEFPYDIIVRIAEAIEAKDAGPEPPGAPTIKIYRPLAAVTSAVTGAAEATTQASVRVAGIGAGGFVIGGLCAISGEGVGRGYELVYSHDGR